MLAEGIPNYLSLLELGCQIPLLPTLRVLFQKHKCSCITVRLHLYHFDLTFSRIYHPTFMYKKCPQSCRQSNSRKSFCLQIFRISRPSHSQLLSAINLALSWIVGGQWHPRIQSCFMLRFCSVRWILRS